MTISIGTVEQFPIQARIPWILPKQNNLKYILGTINAVLTYYFWNEGLEARLNHFSLDDGHNRRRNEVDVSMTEISMNATVHAHAVDFSDWKWKSSIFLINLNVLPCPHHKRTTRHLAFTGDTYSLEHVGHHMWELWISDCFSSSEILRLILNPKWI